jgi:hypothetical protein
MDKADREKAWNISYSNNEFRLTSPDHSISSIRKEDLKSVTIETDDTGPSGGDVLWYLSGDDHTLVFPLGASGEKDLLNELQKLDGFNYQKLIKAMESTDIETFILWQKK